MIKITELTVLLALTVAHHADTLGRGPTPVGVSNAITPTNRIEVGGTHLGYLFAATHLVRSPTRAIFKPAEFTLVTRHTRNSAALGIRRVKKIASARETKKADAYAQSKLRSYNIPVHFQAP